MTMTKRYDHTGARLTDCCGAYSTVHEDDGSLCCKACWQEVEMGEGDGSERLAETIAVGDRLIWNDYLVRVLEVDSDRSAPVWIVSIDAPDQDWIVPREELQADNPRVKEVLYREHHRGGFER